MSIRPLIVFDKDHYRVDDETAAWLATRQKPFAVLALCGKFRTGKSYLLNRLTRKPPGQGFGVGDTVQACTRGIWVSTDFLTVDGKDVLIMDTEGIDALDAESEHDVRIFALALLMCTAFAYNSMSHLDEAAVQTLSLMTRVADSVGDGAHRPSLYWILRDFSLQLVSADGKPMSHREYLEQALTVPASSGKCATRDAIKHVFEERHLVTLPRPHKGESAQNLEKKSAGSVQPKFERFLDVFRTHLCENTRPYSVSGVPVTGPVYVEHIRNMVDRVNSGVIPKIEDSWTLLSRVQHGEVIAAARTRLLSSAEEACPDATEDEVSEWVWSRCREEFASLTFIPPRPAEDTITTQLASDVMTHVRALGRIKDAGRIAKECVDSCISKFVASGYTDVLTLTLPTSMNTHVQGIASRLMMTSLVTSVLPDAMRAHEVAGRHAERSILETEIQRVTNDADVLRDTLREERERFVESVEGNATASYEHASTQTETGDDDGVTGTFMEREERNEERNEDMERRMSEMRARLMHEEERATRAEEDLRETQDRESRASATFEEHMDILRAETMEHIQRAQEERDSAIATAKTLQSQRAAIDSECTQMREHVREAQVRTVEVHKYTIEELQRRDSQFHLLATEHRKEQVQYRAQAEGVLVENRALKRRIDELLQTTEDVKRMRTTNQTLEVERAREEGERAALQDQLTKLRSENEGLRVINVEVQNRIAVLQATAKLETCRKSFASSGKL